MAVISGSKSSKHGIISTRTLLIIAIIAIVGVVALVAYLDVLVNSVLGSLPSAPTGQLPVPQLHPSLVDRDLLSYDSFINATTGTTVPLYYVPYVLIDYNARNVSTINANVSLYKYKPPQTRRIYIFNTSNQCWECGNTDSIISHMENYLERYGIINGSENISIVSTSGLTSIPNDSILIVMNGLFPSQFFGIVNSNTTRLQYLLNRHVSIVYLGQDFLSVVDPSGAERPTVSIIPNNTFPYYLQTKPFSGNLTDNKTGTLLKNGFYFNRSTFEFYNGTVYSGYISYESVLNGSIVAFSNVTSSWPNVNETGYDMAKAIRQMFWLPKYAYGIKTIKTSSMNSSGQIGVLLNSMNLLKYNTEVPSIINSNGTFRILLTANGTYPYRVSNNTYSYMLASPNLYYNGTIGMPTPVITNQTVDMSFVVLTNSSIPIALTPHVTIYTINGSEDFGPGVALQLNNVTNNAVYDLPQRFALPPGRSYIIKLYSFQQKEYASSYFNVSPIVLNLTRSNITTDQFLFSVKSDSIPVKNIPYTIELNNAYPENGVVYNGTIYYTMPSGTPTIHGNLNFTISIYGTNSHYNTFYNPIPFAINDQYIAIVVVVVIMLTFIVLVRAPNRDEFYIDVPNLPAEKKTSIKIKASEMVSIFDKLNTLYHWRYMPLSKPEIRYAIYSNIRYNNIPVGLTYENVERILDQLTVKKYLVAADDLYAPAQWTAQSKHDIEYLATFKKLRMYLVMHGYIFTDIDASTGCDTVATLHNERKYIIIYSKTSKFQKVPIYAGSKTYIVFLNSYKLDEFKSSLYSSATNEADELRMYIDARIISLADADNMDGAIN